MKTIDLNEFSVTELQIDEARETNGGLLWYAALGVGIAIAAATQIITDWDNFKKGLAGEPEIQ